MTETEYARKLDELDRLLNDPDAPMEASRIWSLLAEISSVTGIADDIYLDSANIRKFSLAKGPNRDSTVGMIRRGFLDGESRQALLALMRDGLAAHRLTRRANALLLLDDGLSCEAIARVLFLDDDTIRGWYQLYQEDGFDGLASFNHEGGSCRLTVEQQDKLKA